MAIVAWVSEHWAALCGVVGMVLGVVANLLHLFKKDAEAASVEGAEKVVDGLAGQKPPGA